MKLKIFQVDAFAEELFQGNPAAVIPLSSWMDENVMQKIADENNLSETAFFVKGNNEYHIRWFTPTTEVDLCGHATLASSFVIFNFIEENIQQIKFTSKRGNLFVSRKGDLITLDFPAVRPVEKELNQLVLDCFPVKPIKYFTGNFDLVLFDSEEFIKNYEPDFELLKKLHQHGVIITAKGRDVDFVSRVFVPNEGINEDPVTGSAHTMLVPYWANVLNKKSLTAKQVSKRGGKLWLEDNNDRVLISGKAKLFFVGEIEI